MNVIFFEDSLKLNVYTSTTSCLFYFKSVVVVYRTKKIKTLFQYPNTSWPNSIRPRLQDILLHEHTQTWCTSFFLKIWITVSFHILQKLFKRQQPVNSSLSSDCTLIFVPGILEMGFWAELRLLQEEQNLAWWVKNQL